MYSLGTCLAGMACRGRQAAGSKAGVLVQYCVAYVTHLGVEMDAHYSRRVQTIECWSGDLSG